MPVAVATSDIATRTNVGIRIVEHSVRIIMLPPGGRLVRLQWRREPTYGRCHGRSHDLRHHGRSLRARGRAEAQKRAPPARAAVRGGFTHRSLARRQADRTRRSRPSGARSGEPRLVIRDGVLVCEVSDPNNTQPRMRRARTTDEDGRGLFLVEVVIVGRCPRCFTVWRGRPGGTGRRTPAGGRAPRGRGVHRREAAREPGGWRRPRHTCARKRGRSPCRGRMSRAMR